MPSTCQHNIWQVKKFLLAIQLVRTWSRVVRCYVYLVDIIAQIIFHACVTILNCILPAGAESNTRRSYFPSCPALYRRSSPESQTTVTLWSLEPCLGTNFTVPTNPSPSSWLSHFQSGPLTTLVPRLIYIKVHKISSTEVLSLKIQI